MCIRFLLSWKRLLYQFINVKQQDFPFYSYEKRISINIFPDTVQSIPDISFAVMIEVF